MHDGKIPQKKKKGMGAARGASASCDETAGMCLADSMKRE
jgi:hypothetical protein